MHLHVYHVSGSFAIAHSRPVCLQLRDLFIPTLSTSEAKKLTISNTDMLMFIALTFSDSHSL